MKQLISMIFSFIQTVIAVGLIGSALCLLASEVRLAALKKASQGLSISFQFSPYLLLELFNQARLPAIFSRSYLY